MSALPELNKAEQRAVHRIRSKHWPAAARVLVFTSLCGAIIFLAGSIVLLLLCVGAYRELHDGTVPVNVVTVSDVMMLALRGRGWLCAFAVVGGIAILAPAVRPQWTAEVSKMQKQFSTTGHPDHKKRRGCHQPRPYLFTV